MNALAPTKKQIKKSNIASFQEKKGELGNADAVNSDEPDLIQFQHTIGNQRVLRLLTATTPNPVQLTVIHDRRSRAVIQRVLATNPATLGNGAPGWLTAAIGLVSADITAYNLVANNGGLALATKTQQQLDLLRQLNRHIYAAMDLITQHDLELSNNPFGQALHTLHEESDAEHEQSVNSLVNSPALAGGVNPFDTGGMNPLQVAQNKALWTSMMGNQGKIKTVGGAANQIKTRSMLTQIMDTAHGRNLLGALNAPDAARGQGLADEMSNVYIGENTAQLPGTVRGHGAYNPMMQANPAEAQAQPLRPEATTQLGVGVGGAGHNAVNNPDDFVDEVLGGARGVSSGGTEYDFNAQGSGSFVNLPPRHNMPVVTSTDQPLGPGGAMAKGEAYMPDWVLLGHELGHSANQRAGAGTSSRPGLSTPATQGISNTMAGVTNAGQQQAKEGLWYGGSEEYLNIKGNENRLRAQAGLSERGAHVSPKFPRFQRRGAAINAALQINTWAGQAGNFNAALNTEYGLVNAHIVGALNADSTQVQYNTLLAKANMFGNFAVAVMNLYNAHQAAGKVKRFQYYAWWKGVPAKINGISAPIIANNAAAYANRFNPITQLRQDYT